MAIQERFNLITDRTQDDADRLMALLRKGSGQWSDAERAAFIQASNKGAYNASDLNRVQDAMEYIADRLAQYGCHVPELPRPSVSGRDYWKISDTPTLEQLAQYRANVAAIRESISVLRSTPSVPADMEHLTPAQANHIEQILIDVDLLLTNMTQSWFYAGDLYAGEI